jgi:hypothetical protein
MFIADMHFVDSRILDSRKSHHRYSRSPNFRDLHIVDLCFGEVHTDRVILFQMKSFLLIFYSLFMISSHAGILPTGTQNDHKSRVLDLVSKIILVIYIFICLFLIS